jgi:hypothetical protein
LRQHGSEALARRDAAAFFPSVFGLATGGVRIIFADIEQSEQLGQ